MDTDIESVRGSLVNTYAELRMKMRATAGGGQSVEPIEQAGARGRCELTTPPRCNDVAEAADRRKL